MLGRILRILHNLTRYRGGMLSYQNTALIGSHLVCGARENESSNWCRETKPNFNIWLYLVI
jgi:hypothetical protein